MKTILVVLSAVVTLAWMGCNLPPEDGLQLKIIFDDTKGLVANAPVVFVLTGKVVGRVSSIRPRDSGLFEVQVDIEEASQHLVREGALFAIDAPVFTKRPVQVVFNLRTANPKTPRLKTGATLKGVSYASLALAGYTDHIDSTVESLLDLTDRTLDETEKLVRSSEFDRLLETLRHNMGRISQFGAAQKRRLMEEIIPELEKKIEQAFENENDQADLKQLKRELSKLKERLTVDYENQ